jgi:hypothetical protein
MYQNVFTIHISVGHAALSEVKTGGSQLTDREIQHCSMIYMGNTMLPGYKMAWVLLLHFHFAAHNGCMSSYIVVNSFLIIRLTIVRN